MAIGQWPVSEGPLGKPQPLAAFRVAGTKRQILTTSAGERSADSSSAHLRARRRPAWAVAGVDARGRTRGGSCDQGIRGYVSDNRYSLWRAAGDHRRRPIAFARTTRRRKNTRTVERTGDPGCDRSLSLFSQPARSRDRKSTRLNSSHANISYAVF